MANPKSILATASGLTALVLATLLFGLGAILTAWIPPRGRAMAWCARNWSRCWLWSSGVRLEVERDPALDPGGSYVFLANHASWMDIPALLASLPGEVRFAAKRSLFRIPIFGWALAAGGFIPVDREDKSRAREMLSAALAGLAHGGSALFFPEGTRSPDGQLLPFQRGGFLLALKSGLPVVPVGISGSRAVMPRQGLAIHPGTIRLRYGAPIATAELGLRGRQELMAAVRDQIERLAGLASSATSATSATPDRPLG